MSRELPDNYKLIFSKDQLAARVSELAKEISAWAGNLPAGEQVLAVCILRGGVYFFADLVRNMTVSVEHAFCRSWGYSAETNSANFDNGRLDFMGLNAKGRKILLIDDICDTGTTFKRIREHFLKEGALDCKTIALIHREIPNQVCQPDWLGFKFAGEEWLVGQGLDDRDTNSNLPDIYCIKK